MRLLVVASIIALFAIIGPHGLYVRLRRKWRRRQEQRRRAFVASYVFPADVLSALKAKYPKLTDDDVEEVFLGFRDYILICHEVRDQVLAVPSRAVDTIWQAFTQHTQEYKDFCDRALGRFLPYVPANPAHSRNGGSLELRWTWWLACARACINSAQPKRMPRLFDLDKRLNIPNGICYVLEETDSVAFTGKHKVFVASEIGRVNAIGLGKHWSGYVDAPAVGSAAYLAMGGGFAGGSAGGGCGHGAMDSSGSCR